MADLNFQLDKTITAMMSGEGERIEFDSLVDPKDKPVEFWMGEVEQMMFTSVRSVLKHSITDYTKKDRNEWILEHPGQCVLNGSQVHWTSEIEEAIEKNTVAEYYKLLETQILETVKLVRQRLNKLQSITLGALIVIDVHGKDVVQALRDQKISSINEFEWIKQMRYYWEEDDCRVKCIQTDFPYGYEYLGNTQRLVITPLTDKCYMTLMGALKLNLGGAPAGPAGTGKTESTKDLAKALAKQCVVFNCSSDMEYSLLGRFFKGLAASGAWCCFDEFNRINIEVLSVIAQALQKLFAAKGERIPEMEFEDSIIQLKPTFCVFITMNPGYAGRTELPDNLKALFRPVAMMVPDYGLIGRIMLYSFGFNQAVTLANKMAQTFKLSSEQLSSQFHYDYGMRAVRSVINAAGILKRASPDMDEDQLLLRALKDVNVPKFLKDDIPLFNNIIKDLFPRVEQPAIDYGELLVEIKNSCKHYVIQPVDVFIEKIMQLYDTCQVRHGLMLVGPSGGGKTANYKTLARALSALAGQGDFKKVNYHILNPKSITMGQLYGELDTATQEWNDGVAAKIVADSAADPTTEKHWVMFDGPVDAIWIESMNTVLDDNKKLCLNSGQIIPLSDHMTMMFEVEDLQAASPATVSRCGMVYMEPGALGLTPLIKTYREMLPDPIRLLRPKHTVPLIDKLIAKYLEVLISFTRKHCPEPVITVNNNLCQSFMRVLDCYFNNYKDTELKTVTPDEIENLEHMMEPLIVFSLVWSVGCTTTIEGRTKFSNKLRELMGKENKHKFPAQGTVYDY